MHATAGILDQAAIRGAALPLTVAQYHRLSAEGIVPERTELLRGVIIEQMTKSPLHTFLVQRLARWIETAASQDSGLLVRKEEPLTLTDSEPEPDIAVVTGSPDDYRSAHPSTALLIIEVAIATLGIDRAKADVYAAAGIPEYWIVVPEAHAIEIHRQPGPDGYRERRTLSAAQDVLVPPLPALSPISVEQIFA